MPLPEQLFPPHEHADEMLSPIGHIASLEQRLKEDAQYNPMAVVHVLDPQLHSLSFITKPLLLLQHTLGFMAQAAVFAHLLDDARQ